MAKGKYWGIELYNLEQYKLDRANVVGHKCGAIDIHFDELDGIINITKFSKRFMNKSQSWFSQRLHGSRVMRKEFAFKEKEFEMIAAGYRELARQLNQYADELDKAEMCVYEQPKPKTDDCIFYDGNDNIPKNIKDLPSGLTFWEAEKMWVKNKGTETEMKAIKFFLDCRVKQSIYELSPFLCACLFSVYCSMSDTDPKVLALTFENDILTKYLEQRKIFNK